MAGNVWEWTNSLYKPYPYNYNTDDGREEVKSAEKRVVRGGSHVNYARYARAAYRYHYRPTYRDAYIGFRLSCGAPL